MKNVAIRRLSRKTANMRSARAGAVQTLFLSVILCRFLPQCGPGSHLKWVRKILMQNTHLLCALGSFWVPRVLPKPSPGAHFAVIFGTFCMTWADDLSRLVQTPVSTEKRPSRHTNQQFCMQNNHPGSQIVKLTN